MRHLDGIPCGSIWVSAFVKHVWVCEPCVGQCVCWLSLTNCQCIVRNFMFRITCIPFMLPMCPIQDFVAQSPQTTYFMQNLVRTNVYEENLIYSKCGLRRHMYIHSLTLPSLMCTVTLVYTCVLGYGPSLLVSNLCLTPSSVTQILSPLALLQMMRLEFYHRLSLCTCFCL